MGGVALLSASSGAAHVFKSCLAKLFTVMIMIMSVCRIRFQYLGSIELPLQDSVAKRDDENMNICYVCASQFHTECTFIPKLDSPLIEKKNTITYSDKLMAGMTMKRYYGTSLKLIS